MKLAIEIAHINGSITCYYKILFRLLARLVGGEKELNIGGMSFSLMSLNMLIYSCPHKVGLILLLNIGCEKNV